MRKRLEPFSGSFKAYFLGVGGASMSALATYLAKKGVCVGGCDKVAGEFIPRLLNCGVAVDILGNLGADNVSADNLSADIQSGEIFSGAALLSGARVPNGLLNADLVVYTSALAKTDELLSFCRKIGKPMLSRAQLLREIMDSYPFSIGVGGTHGKTTCTCMLAHIFKQADKKFCAHIGGADKILGNLYLSGNDCFISEVCEYKRNISLFSPTIGIILNADNDHLDSYGSFSSVCAEFLSYGRRSKLCVYNADDKALRLISGTSISLKNPACDYYAERIVSSGGVTRFNAFERGRAIGRFKIKSGLIHNVLNALAAMAAARLYGISIDKIRRGLYSFCGVERREEWLGVAGGALIFADYCHHPAQIKQTLAALGALKGKRLTVVFQPHTYSRTKNLFEQFVCALKTVNARLIITDTYAAREPYDYFGSGERLASEISGSEYIPEKSVAAQAALKGALNNDVIAFLGAGDIYAEAKRLAALKTPSGEKNKC